MEVALQRNRPDVDVELVGGHRGIFDVYLDDVLVFSKHAEHRFPKDEEILAALLSPPP